MTGNIIQAVSVLRVSDFEAAEAFYCGRLGFTKDWAYQLQEGQTNPTYAGLSRDGAQVHVSSFSGDGASGQVALFYVRDVDALFAEFDSRGVAFDLEPTDQTWGTREMYVKDADGNSLRFSQPVTVAAGAG
jgi:catechol 2,3-dioxygenase-like lactoylglutathione lyase family enzyme